MGMVMSIWVSLSSRSEGSTSNGGWILKSDIVAMHVDTISTSWVLLDQGFILVHGWWDIIMLEVIDVTTETDLSLWDWGTEVSSSLVMSFLIGSLDKTVVVHDWMPKGELHIVDELENSSELFLREPVSLSGKEGTVTHARGNGMTVKHTSWELVSWRPGVTESVRSALMGLPKVSILRLDVRLHSLSNDSIAKVLELSIIFTSLSTELGSNESGSSFLDKAEEWVVLDASHLDDLGNTVSDPSLMKSLPEESIGESEDWWVISSIKILEAVSIAACSW